MKKYIQLKPLKGQKEILLKLFKEIMEWYPKGYENKEEKRDKK